MKKLLSLFFISLFLLSIMASVSDDLQTKIRSYTNGNTYSAATVPVPKVPTQKSNLAANEDVKSDLLDNQN